jgi:tetratricopeptide (TPR) repeat protein
VCAQRRNCVWIALLASLLAGGCRSTAPQYWKAGQTELEAGNFETAVNRLERSRGCDPEFAPTYLALAAAYSRTGDFDAVATALEQYLSLHPDHHVAHLYLAECLQSLGDLEGARNHYLHFAHRTSPWTHADLRRLAHTFERLSALAALRDDPFEESMYAGIGAYYRGKHLLAAAQESDPQAVAVLTFEPCLLPRSFLWYVTTYRMDSEAFMEKRGCHGRHGGRTELG